MTSLRSMLGAAAAGSLLLAAGAAAAGRAREFRQAGISVGVPVGWFVTTEPLNGVTDPVQRFVLSSARVPVGADAGAGWTPPARAVLAQLVEEVPPISSDSKDWPSRPARFRIPRLGRMETLSGNRWGEILFRERGRDFYLFVWVGRRATAARVATLLQALDRLRVSRR